MGNGSGDSQFKVLAKVTELDERLTRVEDRLGRLDERVGRLEAEMSVVKKTTLDILGLVQKISERLMAFGDAWNDHEHRLQRVEQVVASWH